MLLEEFDGTVPGDESILKLPGVGPYVGNMVLCLAYDRRTAPVDANAGRVLSRVFELRSQKSSGRPGRNSEVLSVAGECLPGGGVRRYNLGLLDFGSRVCRSQNPRCESCPLISGCSAKNCFR